MNVVKLQGDNVISCCELDAVLLEARAQQHPLALVLVLLLLVGGRLYYPSSTVNFAGVSRCWGFRETTLDFKGHIC